MISGNVKDAGLIDMTEASFILTYQGIAPQHHYIPKNVKSPSNKSN